MTSSKQNWAVINFVWLMFFSFYFANFWNKNAHTVDIFIIWCYVSAFGLCYFYRYSLSSADKMEKGKDLKKKNSSEVKWLPFLIHENKLLLTPHRQATLIFSFTDNFSFHLVDIFSVLAAVCYSGSLSLTFDLSKTGFV